MISFYIFTVIVIFTVMPGPRGRFSYLEKDARLRTLLQTNKPEDGRWLSMMPVYEALRHPVKDDHCYLD